MCLMIINVLVIILMIVALSCLGYTAYYIVKTRAHAHDTEAKLLSASILIILAIWHCLLYSLRTYGLLQAVINGMVAQL